MKSQIEMGLAVEAEHVDLYEMLLKYAENFYRGKVEVGVSFPTLDEFKMRIVLDHLREDPEYYTHLEAMEKASHKSLKARAGKYKR
jgi:hypothetical protein